MPFDISAILALSCAVTALQGAIMLMLWTRRREDVWLPWRAATFVLGGGFLFLFVIDDESLRQVSIGLGTATFIAATFTVWTSSRVFASKPVVWPALIAAIGVWAGLGILTDTLDSLLPAVLMQSLAGIFWIGGGAWEHWQARREGRTFGEWGVIVLYAAVALFFAARLPFVMAWPFPFGALETEHAWVAALVIGLDIAAVLLTTFTLTGLRWTATAATAQTAGSAYSASASAPGSSSPDPSRRAGLEPRSAAHRAAGRSSDRGRA